MSTDQQAESCIRRFRHTTDSKVLMVCLPSLDGVTACFRAFAEALAPSIEVVAVRSTGGPGEPPQAGAAAHCDRAVADLCRGTARPVVLFGHGTGALAALEMTGRLERHQAIDPVALFVAGSRAPSRLHADDTIGGGHHEGTLAEVIPLRRGPRTAGERHSGADAAAGRVRNAADERHSSGEPVRVRAAVFALGGRDDAGVEVDDILGWRDHTAGEFKVKMFPGGASFLDEHFAGVVNAVTDFLLPVLGGDVVDLHHRR